MGIFEGQVNERIKDPESYEGWVEAEQEIAAFRASQLSASSDDEAEPQTVERPTKGA
jgi:hypothetical protein